MASITVNIAMTKTVATLNATTIQAVFDWIKTNIRDKLPADTAITTSFTLTE